MLCVVLCCVTQCGSEELAVSQLVVMETVTTVLVCCVTALYLYMFMYMYCRCILYACFVTMFCDCFVTMCFVRLVTQCGSEELIVPHNF